MRDRNLLYWPFGWPCYTWPFLPFDWKALEPWLVNHTIHSLSCQCTKESCLPLGCHWLTLNGWILFSANWYMSHIWFPFLKNCLDSQQSFIWCPAKIVPILSHFYANTFWCELFEVGGSSHWDIGQTSQWLLPPTSKSSHQIMCPQKWLKFGKWPSEYRPYNISYGPNFFKKSEYANTHFLMK